MHNTFHSFVVESVNKLFMLFCVFQGEPFEASKGTRGMMERWKGARLANKKEEKIELNALLSNTGLRKHHLPKYHCIFIAHHICLMIVTRTQTLFLLPRAVLTCQLDHTPLRLSSPLLFELHAFETRTQQPPNKTDSLDWLVRHRTKVFCCCYINFTSSLDFSFF